LPAKIFNRCKPELIGAFTKPAGKARRGCEPTDIRFALDDRPSLAGAGDVVLVLAGWPDPAAGEKPRLWLNGAEVTNAVDLVGTERVPGQDTAFVTLRLNPGTQSRALWSNLIRNAGLSAKVPLLVGLGANAAAAQSAVSAAVNTIPGIANYTPTIAVTVSWRLWLAAGLIVLFGGGAITLAFSRNVLKDQAPLAVADLFDRASRLTRQWKARAGTINSCIAAYYPGYQPNTPGSANYNPCMPTGVDLACLEAAEGTLASKQVPADPKPSIVGIIQGRREWSYSLAATQLFLWFLFALLSGIYFWAIYGQMPAIDNSILGLLGISASTAGVAWAVDKSAQSLPGGPSTGFFSDLITDASNDARIHRFQAVFVNGALLVVGISNIVLDMEYPTFDQTWLIFLTISGITYTAGKKIKEDARPM